MTSRLNLRPAVRVVLLDPADRVLLVRWHFPDQPADRGPRDVWGTPGGGIEAGESHPEAVLRELREETGLRLDPSDCGPCVAHRRHVIPFGGGYDGQEEWFYLVRVPAFDPAPALSGAELRAESLHELRWCSLDEVGSLADGDRVVCAPRELAALLARLAGDGHPATPIELGV